MIFCQVKPQLRAQHAAELDTRAAAGREGAPALNCGLVKPQHAAGLAHGLGTQRAGKGSNIFWGSSLKVTILVCPF